MMNKWWYDRYEEMKDRSDEGTSVVDTFAQDKHARAILEQLEVMM